MNWVCKKQLKHKIIGAFLLSVFSVSNCLPLYAAEASEQATLAPSLRVDARFFAPVMRSALTAINTPAVDAGKPLYVIDSIEELPKRLRDAKETELLLTVSRNNLIAGKELSDRNRGKFIFVDLHLADYLMSRIQPQYRDLCADDGLYDLYYYTVVVSQLLKRLSEQTPGRENIQVALTNTEDKDFSELFVVYKTKRGVRSELARMIEESLDADILMENTSVLSPKSGFFDSDITIIHVMLQDHGRQLSKSKLLEFDFGPGCDRLSISQLRNNQEYLLRLARSRYAKNQEVEPITPALQDKLRKGFSVYGIPNLTESRTVIGKIVAADFGQSYDLSYPLMPYKPDDVEKEINDLRRLVEKTISGLDISDRNSAVIMQAVGQAFFWSEAYARKTGQAPVVKFLSELIDFLKKSDIDRDVEKKIADEAISISQAMYWRSGRNGKDETITPRTEKERLLADAGRDLIADLSADIASDKHAEGDIPIGIFEITAMLTKDTLRDAMFLLRSTDCSIEEALFRAVQPVVCGIMRSFRDDETSKLYNDVADIEKELLKRLQRLREGKTGEDDLVVDNVSGQEPFFLLLRHDINTLLEYRKLRNRYPNMVGIITRSGVKHYRITAKQEGFPVLADSVALVGERRVNIMDAVQGGETAILNTAEHLLRVNPSAEEYREATMQILKQKAQDRYVESKVGDQVVTRDGVMLSVMANLDRHEEASRLPGKSLAGIALYRTENEYEGRDAISEEEWVSIFTSVLRDSGVEVLSIRLPDRQKSVRGKDIKDSKAFGSGRIDGIKFLLNDPIGRDIAGTVLRAAIRVSNQGAKIRVFFPMIVTVGEWRQARKLFDEASEVLIDKRIITEEDAARVNVGLMFETPEAIVSSRVLMQNADFGSIGTNDLIARLQDEPMERDASEISAKYTQLTPELLNYLDLLVHNARKLDKPFPLSLCGMLASSPESLLYFAYAKADRGIEIIPSVGAGEAAYVKEFIRHIDTGNLTRIFTSPEIRTNAKALRAALAVEIERIDNEIVRESDEILRAMVDLSLETYERNSSLSEMKTAIARSTDIDQSI